MGDNLVAVYLDTLECLTADLVTSGTESGRMYAKEGPHGHGDTLDLDAGNGTFCPFPVHHVPFDGASQTTLLNKFCDTGAFVYHDKEAFCEHLAIFFSDFFRSEYDHFVTEIFVNKKIANKLYNLIDRGGKCVRGWVVRQRSQFQYTVGRQFPDQPAPSG